jgi:XTP/dITP diphosphohydrolase
MRLLVATQNRGKQQEIKTLLALPGLDLVFPNDLPAVSDFDVVEDGKTFAENAELKARAFAKASNMLSVAEDTGLQVTALDNKPGVASKRWHLGSDLDRNTALLHRLAGNKNRAATFITVACIFDPATNKSSFFTGEMAGEIATKISAGTGFGYDPIFIPAGEKQTLAELGVATKNKISHRARAFMQVRSYLESRL